MNIRSSPTFTQGKKLNIRLICFELWLVCKSLTKEQLKCLFSCSVAQKREAEGAKMVFLWEHLPITVLGGWSCTANDYSCMTLPCNTKMAKITVITKTFIPPKASFWVLDVSFIVNPLCLQGSICTCCGFLPFLSEYNNEGKIPSLLLSKVIMENCRNLSGAVRCLHSTCRKSLPKTLRKAIFSRLKKKGGEGGWARGT